MRTRSVLPIVAAALLGLLLLSFQLLLGQEAGTPIAAGQNMLGVVSTEAPVIRFSLSGQAGDVTRIQVLATTPTLTPSLRVLDASGGEIFADANPAAALNLAGAVSFQSAATYTIEVAGVGGSVGQFVISLLAGTPLASAVDLEVGQEVAADLPAASVQSYRLTVPAETPLILVVASDQTDAPLTVTLRDDATGETVALSTALAVSYRLPTAGASYRLEVSHSSEGTLPISVCTTSGSALEACALAAVELSAETAAAVTVQSLSSQSINVRAGAGTEYGVLGVLTPDQPIEVLGQTVDGTWLQVRLSDSEIGWVAASLVVVQGASISDLPALNVRGGSVIEEIPNNGLTIMDPVYVTLTANPGFYLTPTALSATISPNELVEAPNLIDANLIPTPSFEDLAQVTPVPMNAGRAASFADSFPDLSVYGWSINPTGYPPGTVQFLILNEGGVDAPSFQIQVCNGTDCMYYVSGGIAAHSQQLIDRPLPPRSGLNTVTISLDIDNVVTESYENNNDAVYTAELP